MKFVFRIFGALLNRVRGGLWKEYLPSNKIYYPLFLGICAYYKHFDIECSISTAIAGYVGQQIVGWGAYIGALTMGALPHPECEMIDKIIDNAKLTWRGKKYYLINYTRAWGFAGLIIRGLIWSFLIGLAVNSINVMLSGVLMPICYLIPTLILWKTKYHNSAAAWNTGEVLWGGVLTAVVVW